MDIFQNYTNGEWTDSSSGNLFEDINPSTGEVVGQFQRSVKEDVDKAVQAAKKAFAVWNQTPLKEREELMLNAAVEFEKSRDEIAVACTQEMGKPLAASNGEVNRAIEHFRWFAGEVRRVFGRTHTADNPKNSLYTIRQPLGVVGLINPWNFPIATPAGKIASAIAYGNTTVVKPAHDAPLSAIRLGECLDRAGFPPGVINILTGTGREAGSPIVDHPDVRAISFTGSTTVGVMLRRRCGELGKRAQLELGGHNPVIVMPDGNLDSACEAITLGAFSVTGQRCTSTRRALLHKSIWDQCVELIVAKTKRLVVGDGIKNNVDIGPVVNEESLTEILSAVEDAVSKGAKVHYGGSRLIEGEYSTGSFMEPTILSEVDPRMYVSCNEVFGPVLSLLPFKTFEEALEKANDVPFGLTASIYTSDLDTGEAFIRGIQSGVVHVNDPTYGSSVHAPFGGLKDSSFGPHEQGDSPLEFYTEVKSVFVGH